MKSYLILLLLINVLMPEFSVGQEKKDKPSIEFCDCHFKIDKDYMKIVPPAIKSDSIFHNTIDSSFTTQCGYLVVPENREKANSNTIKLPFIIVKSKNPNKKKDPVLFTGGGPGASSLGWANGITKSTLILDRDCIAFEQRGTKFAQPYLRNFELDISIRESYRKNLPKDSMEIEGVKRYKKSLEDRGIDLSGYNTDETVADIHDLLNLLRIDSVNLFGISYSGSLMLSVLKKEPSRIRSLVLNSPLPNFTPIDEDEPANFMEALNVLFSYVENDSVTNALYPNLKEQFHNYFTAINNKVFYFPYVENGKSDTLQVAYTKNDLLHIIVSNMYSQYPLKEVPFIISEIIKGNHTVYIKERLDGIFNKNPAPDGMRISVYCADEASYHNEDILHQLYQLYPYLEGFHINDVYKAICNCWKIPPVKEKTTQPYYSNKPVLIGDGEMDPACRPLYMGMIKHYMPNAQCFLFKNRSHGVGGKDFYEMTQFFLDHPYEKIEINSENIISY